MNCSWSRALALFVAFGWRGAIVQLSVHQLCSWCCLIGGSCVCQLAVQYLSFHQPKNQFLKKQYNSEDDLFMVYLKNALFYCSFKGWYYCSNLVYRRRHHHFYHRYFHCHCHCHCHHFYHHRHERHEQPSFCPALPHNPVAVW